MARSNKKTTVPESYDETEIRRLIYGPATFAALSLLLLIAITFIDSRTTQFSSLRELDATTAEKVEHVVTDEEKLLVLQQLIESSSATTTFSEGEKEAVLYDLSATGEASRVTTEEKLRLLEALRTQ